MAVCAWLALEPAAMAANQSGPGDLPVDAAGVLNGGPAAEAAFASDRIIVRFTPAAMGVGTGVPLAQGVGNHLQPAVSGAVHATCRAWGVTTMRRCITEAFANPQLAQDLGLDRTFVLSVPPGTDVQAMAADFRGFAGEVESAGVDGIGQTAGVFPNDADFFEQWSLHNIGQAVFPPGFPIPGTPDADIDAPEAWAIHTGIPTGNQDPVTIAIVDSGVTPHIDFGNQLLAGTNIVSPGSTTSDGCPHGTHVAGIAAAAGDNGMGVAGVTWGANILPVRVLGGCPSNPSGCCGVVSDTADGIIWAVDHGADVINISLQFYSLGQTSVQMFEAAVDYAHSNGVLVVAAAGNQRGFVVAYPAILPNAMAVSATNSDDGLYSLSNYGCEVDVSAPGKAIWSTWPSPPNGYRFLDGTSMATPHVSGLAALLKSYLPGASPDQLRALIAGTTDSLGDPCDQCNPDDQCGPGNPGNPDWNFRFGSGRINAGNAMAAAAAIPRMLSSDPPDGAIDARQPGDPDGTNPVGWDQVTLVFDKDASSLIPADFSLVDSAGAAGPAVLSVVAETSDTVTLMLDGPIAVGQWTTIRHTITDTSVRLGYLPGDVNADGTATPADILAVIDGLNGVIKLPIWSSDADRGGVAGPEDILRVIDLLNGAASFDSYLDVSLP